MIIKTTNDYKTIQGLCITADDHDGIQVKNNNSIVEHNKIINTKKHKGHLDAIQLIPINAYALGRLNIVKVRHNIILSTENLQGIFASDGVFHKLEIHSNKINTSHVHKIAINGMLNGFINNNYDTAGNIIVANLRMARIGGGNNIWIKSFNDTLDYGRIEGDCRFYNDMRFKTTGLRGVLLEGFPVAKYRLEIQKAFHNADGLSLSGNKQARIATDIALDICKHQTKLG